MTSVDLPALGRPTMATRIGREVAGTSLAFVVGIVGGLQPQCGEHLGLEIAETLAMLGGDGDRLAEAELEGRVEAFLGGATLALVGDEHDGASRRAHQFAERLVVRSYALARVDDEQHQIGGAKRRFALLAHALGDRAALGVLEAGRVDDGHGIAGKVGFALAPVARQPRHVGHESRAPSRQPVEQRRLADIGSADDGDNGWSGHWKWPGAASVSGAYRAFAAQDDRSRRPTARLSGTQLRAMSLALSVRTYIRPWATTGAT